jgi:hypothetical protein
MHWTPVLTVVLGAVIGGFIGHWLAARRDRANTKRDQRVQHLLAAYVSFAHSVNHPQLWDIGPELQSALATVQVFGSLDQIKAATAWTVDMVEKKAASLDRLLELLRDELRNEVGLRPAAGPIAWIRINPPS